MAGRGTAHLRPDSEPVLVVEGLVVDYPTRAGTVHAVSDVSFDLLKGETLGLVGESGCGKSTAARAMIQLIEPTAGSVRFEGMELTGLDRRQLRDVRSRLQIIFQDPTASLNPRRRIGQVVAEGLRVWHRGSAAEREQKAREVLGNVGLDYDAVADRKAPSFSGGQCQRISIARALAVEPTVLVCDEPVSSLDVSVQAQIINLLEDMGDRYGLTMLFIGHDLAVIKSVCDRVVVMYLGKVCEVGRPEDLYENPAHPYTAGLLAAVPHPDPARRGERERGLLDGEVPSPLDPPSGCRFRSRCPRATDHCSVVEPEIREVAPQQFVACHYPTPSTSASPFVTAAPSTSSVSDDPVGEGGVVDGGQIDAALDDVRGPSVPAATSRRRRSLRFFAGKFARFVATFLIVTFATVALFNAVPGDPASFIAGEFAPEEAVEAINERYHFDDNVAQQYGRWLGNLVQGDLGSSAFTKEPVLDAVKRAIPVTLELTLLAMVVAMAVSIPVAMYAAYRPGSRFDRAVGFVTSVFISVPVFVWAIVLVFLFAVKLSIFPVLGWTPIEDGLGDNLKGVVLPVTAITLPEIVILTRLLRAELITILQQDYIGMARAKGVPPRRLMTRHALKPASFSLITLSGLQLARLIGGTVLVESIFVLPGLGSLIINSISNRDTITTLGVVTFVSVVILLVNLVIDLAYGRLDPRGRSR